MIFVGLIALLFFIARHFYRLANKYDKNPVPYILMGAGIAIVSVVISIYCVFFILLNYSVGDWVFLAIILGFLTFCIGSVVGSYKLLERRFKQQSKQNSNPDILDL